MHSILFIDDEPVLHSLLSMVFKRAGYAFASAYSGTEGIALAMGGNFDVIVADMTMPGCDGIECVRQLRAAGQQQPIFLMTGDDPNEHRAAAAAAGATGIIAKPCPTDRLLATISGALAGGRNDGGR